MSQFWVFSPSVRLPDNVLRLSSRQCSPSVWLPDNVLQLYVCQTMYSICLSARLCSILHLRVWQTMFSIFLSARQCFPSVCLPDNLLHLCVCKTIFAIVINAMVVMCKLGDLVSTFSVFCSAPPKGERWTLPLPPNPTHHKLLGHLQMS